jgi:hypothetical protein
MGPGEIQALRAGRADRPLEGVNRATCQGLDSAAATA